MDFNKMFINFRKKATVALIFLCMKVKKNYIAICNMKSLSLCMARIAFQRKVPKWLPFKNFQVRITKYLRCIYGGRMCISIPNMKFLCLTLWQEEMCTDVNNDEANARRTKHDKKRLFAATPRS